MHVNSFYKWQKRPASANEIPFRVISKSSGKKRYTAFQRRSTGRRLLLRRAGHLSVLCVHEQYASALQDPWAYAAAAMVLVFLARVLIPARTYRGIDKNGSLAEK